jgi:hypothetical protein
MLSIGNMGNKSGVESRKTRLRSRLRLRVRLYTIASVFDYTMLALLAAIDEGTPASVLRAARQRV